MSISFNSLKAKISFVLLAQHQNLSHSLALTGYISGQFSCRLPFFLDGTIILVWSKTFPSIIRINFIKSSHENFAIEQNKKKLKITIFFPLTLKDIFGFYWNFIDSFKCVGRFSVSQSNDQKHKQKGMLKAVQGQSKYLLDLFLRCY